MEQQTTTVIACFEFEVDPTPRDAIGAPHVKHTTVGGRGKVAQIAARRSR